VTQLTYLETLTQWLDAPREARERAIASCVERIRSLDASIQAWAHVSPQRSTASGPLADVPFGVKDIYETEGLPTEYGSPIYKGRVGSADAALVREMRGRGAVLLGKTHTAAFAYRTPAPTRNPRNLAHTPGGSSSGSAAAVAAGMVPIALGTQTLGSVLRPASYCGVTGFKASYGLLPVDGVLPFAKSLDTLGFFTNTATDMLKLWDSMGYPVGSEEDLPIAAPDPIPEVEPQMAEAFRRTVSFLKTAGVSIRSIDVAGMLAKLADAANTIMLFEGARFHQRRFEQYGAQLAELADAVRQGLEISVERYDEARRFVADCKLRVGEIFKRTPVMLVPAATGPAPLGLAWTGDARMNSPWTALGAPAISIPMPVRAEPPTFQSPARVAEPRSSTEGGLPLGLQLTADHGNDAAVIRAAVRLERMLAAS
jgi:Asp-tRNA(Asn)/Glu-tRNA(Gln) amidotransferase A subunit family amidase